MTSSKNQKLVKGMVTAGNRSRLPERFPLSFRLAMYRAWFESARFGEMKTY